MSDRHLTDAQLVAILRANLPDAAPVVLSERVRASIATTAQARALPSLAGRFADVDPVARRRNLLLAAALLLLAAAMTVVAVGAWRPQSPDLPGAERGLLLSVRNGDLYLAEPDGSNEVLAVHVDGFDLSSPRWSPDGRLIAVQTEEPAILIVDAQTLEVRRLASGSIGSWSPDGRRLLITTPGDRRAVLDIETGRPADVRLTGQDVVLAGYRWPGVWSPDGRSIVVDREDGTLVRIDVETGALTRLGRIELFGWYEVDWAPDGTRLAYTKGAERAGAAPLLIVDGDGRNPRQLIGSDLVPDDPHWSPDGEWIAYTVRMPDQGDQAGERAIEVVRPDGTGRRRLVDGWVRLVGWAPDGRSIAYTVEVPTDDGTPLVELREVNVADGSIRVIRPKTDASEFAWAVGPTGQVASVPPATAPVAPGRSDGPFATPLLLDRVDPSGSATGLGFAMDLGRGCQAVIGTFDGRITPVDESPPPAPRTSGSDDATPEPDATPGPQPAGCPSIRWAPDGSAYAHDDGSRLRVFDRRGASIGVIDGAGSMAWSPDGRWIAARACPTGHEDCDGRWFIARPDGSERHAVPGEPRWSADGRRLAAVADPGGFQAGLWVGRGDGSDLRDIGDLPAPMGWSPDGARFVFLRDGNVWIAGADGSDAHDVSKQALGGVTLASWSPDGRTIAALQGHDLLLLGPDGAGLRRVAGRFADGVFADGLTWSPDGRTLAAQSGVGLVLIPVNDPRPRSVDGEVATWSPDGRYLALASSNGYTDVVNSDGSGRGPHFSSGDLPGAVWLR